MSNKLTDDILKQLIREVLSEGRIFIRDNFKDLSDGPHDTRSGSDRQKLGFQVSSGDWKKMAILAGIDVKNLAELTKDQIIKILKKAREIKGLRINDDNITQAFFTSPEPEEETPKADPEPEAEPPKEDPKPEPPEEEPKKDPSLGGDDKAPFIPPADPDDLGTPEQIRAAETELFKLLNKALIPPLDGEQLNSLAGLNEAIDKLEFSDIGTFLKKYNTKNKTGLPADIKSQESFSKIKNALIRLINSLKNKKKTVTDPATISKLQRMIDIGKKLITGDYDSDQPGFYPFGATLSSQEQVVPDIPIEMGVGEASSQTTLAFLNAFEGARTVEERIQRLAEIASAVKDGRSSGLDVGTTLSGIMILRSLSKILRGLDAGSAGGWVLEGFLGALFGGTDIGSAMGLRDFEIKGVFAADGVVGGSAKLYASGTKEFGGQSLADFFIKDNVFSVGDKVRYVMAERTKEGGGRLTKKDVEEKNLDYVNLSIYILDVVFKRNAFTTAEIDLFKKLDGIPTAYYLVNSKDPSRARFGEKPSQHLMATTTYLDKLKRSIRFEINGVEMDPTFTTTTKSYGGNYELPPAGKWQIRGGKIGVDGKKLFLQKATNINLQYDGKHVYAVKSGKDSNYRLKFDRNQPAAWGEPFKISIPAVEGFEEAFTEALKQTSSEINEMFAEASKMKKNMTQYVVSGDLDYGTESINSYKNLKDKINLAYSSIEGETGASIEITENNKKSKKDLDNLIKEVILKRLLK